MTTVGFIGLGAMGLPMAKNLAAHGFTVRGFDMRTTAVDAPVSGGTVGAAGAAAMMVSVAPVAPTVPPETGASTKPRPVASTRAAMAST